MGGKPLTVANVTAIEIEMLILRRKLRFIANKLSAQGNLDISSGFGIDNNHNVGALAGQEDENLVTAI